jgi:hypothetical protein
MKTRIVIAAAWLALFGAAACAGQDRSVILYEGADRPGGEEVEGPAPPGDYKFGPTELATDAKRVSDTNGDKHADKVEYLSKGQVVGVAEDTNYDGKVDVYKRMANGQVTDEVRDQNYDGVFDIRNRDTNGDGTLDLTESLKP